MQAFVRLAVCLILAALVLPVRAQAPEDRNRGKDGTAALRAPTPDATSTQTVQLPDRTLHIAAIAGFVRLLDDKDAPEADIATTAYTLEGADPLTRPVTFVVNGGPSMASAWLQMGAVEGSTYQLVNEAATRQRDYGHEYNRPESLDALRQALALDPDLHVLIAHGLFDLVCPYYATQLLLNQIPPASGGARVRLVTLPGGHMFYSRDESRQALRAEAAKLIGGSTP